MTHFRHKVLPEEEVSPHIAWNRGDGRAMNGSPFSPVLHEHEGTPAVAVLDNVFGIHKNGPPILTVKRRYL